MNILRTLFLNNSNKQDTTSTGMADSTNTTTDQSIEFMSKFDLRILGWELRINYHKNQQKAAAPLPAPVQKWLKQQQEQFPHADWMMDRVEKSILDEANKNAPAAAAAAAASIKKLVSKAAGQKEPFSDVAVAPTTPTAQAQAPGHAMDPGMDCRQQQASRGPVRGIRPPPPPGLANPLIVRGGKNPFRNNVEAPGVKDGDATSPSGSGSSCEEAEEGRLTPSDGFFAMPRHWKDVVMVEDMEPDAATAWLIPPLAPQTGVPGNAAAAAANGQHYPAQVVNNKKIWQPLHDIPFGPAYQQQQQQQQPFPAAVPSDKDIYWPDSYNPQYKHLHRHLNNRHGVQQYQHAPRQCQPAVANQPRPETAQEMEFRLRNYYNKLYEKQYQDELKVYQLLTQQQLQQQQQQQQLFAPQCPQLLVEQQQQQPEEEEEKGSEGNTTFQSAAQAIDEKETIDIVKTIPSNWFKGYEQEYKDFCGVIMPRLKRRITFDPAAEWVERLGTVGNGVNGDIHEVRFRGDPPVPTPVTKPTRYVLKKVRYATRVRTPEQAEGQEPKHVDDPKRMTLTLGAMSEVFGLTLNHPNLMELHHVFVNQTTLHLEIMMPRMAASLSQLNTKLYEVNAFPYRDEKHIWYIMHEFIQGLSYLHSNGRFHGDIKPANVLVSETGEIKLTDFGFCGNTQKDDYKGLLGTPFYMAPEVSACKFDDNARYGPKSDLYSTGVMMYELRMGDPLLVDGYPFEDDPHYEKITTEEGCKYLASRVPVIKHAASERYIELLTFLLHPNPNERPSPYQLLEDHDFFTYFYCPQNREQARMDFCEQLLAILATTRVMEQV
ncbi:hypothetical protein MBANPS3_000239 [Mucor bainieri]